MVNFEVELPPDLPPSAAVPGLTITYHVTATKSKLFGRKVLREADITVRPLLNICQPPVKIVQDHAVNHVGWAHRGHDFIFAEISLHSCSFALGDKLRLEAGIRNEAKQCHVTGAICSLEMMVSYEYCGNTNPVHSMVVTEEEQPMDIGPNGGCQRTVTFLLQDMPPTGLLGRTDVSIDYRLKLEVITNDEHFPTLNLKVPVIIGTNPAVPAGHDDPKLIDAPPSGPSALSVVNGSQPSTSTSNSTDFNSYGGVNASLGTGTARMARRGGAEDRSLTDVKRFGCSGAGGACGGGGGLGTSSQGACSPHPYADDHRSELEDEKQPLLPRKRFKRTSVNED